MWLAAFLPALLGYYLQKDFQRGSLRDKTEALYGVENPGFGVLFGWAL